MTMRMSKLRSLHDRFQLLVYKFVYKNCLSTATQSSLEPQLPPTRVAFVKKNQSGQSYHPSTEANDHTCHNLGNKALPFKHAPILFLCPN
jgi:hypothetical protein